ncbi:benzoate 1,2-dioxygenase electron transfer component BenC [Nocardioides sediminis]|uniref:benzoate 1,2-dioxygenase electron transfer component BenC n=1 Tax=Nocardioides sediminis TaxID=433648 RepID=UPI002D7879D1|nr:benzoate 1,2-dioxygenase electron transfer component BenC [Nocardioides sediminis]
MTTAMTTTDTTQPTAHQVALSFEDGVTRFIRCAEDQTVADASYRSRINIPLDCRDGACGTCKALCESGEYDGGTYIEDALSPAESADGYVLPCSMKPRSDLVLQIASTSEVAKTRAATYTGEITRLERLSPTTVAFTVETPERDQLAFLPGQYVNVAVPGTEETRSYSFSSAPDDKELSFLVKLTPGGVMSTWLSEQAAVGDEVRFTGPHGSFFLREAERPLLLLAGGTGLAPILSILRRLRDTGSTRPTHLVYGVSTDDDLVELDRLAELAASMPSLTWDHCVSDPSSRAENKGYVTTLVRPEHLYGGDVAVYLCGPPPMVEAVRSHFADQGVVPTGFYYEKFALSGPATPAGDTPALDTPALDTPAGGAPATEPVEQKVAEAPLAGESPGDAPAGGEAATKPAAQKVAGAPLARVPRHLVSRAIAGREVLPASDLSPLGAGASYAVPRAASREVAGQEMLAATDLAPLVEPEPQATEVVAAGGYEIGEEHPSVTESDAIFEARQALELGALELVLGRLTSRQLAGHRLLAEGCVPYVEGDRFVDAAAYTETNAAFHDYLFTLTGNEHLLQAYQALGVKGRMEEVLRTATWCEPRCAQDHLDLVDAIESGDRQAARTLVIEHAERSKATMRRAMADAEVEQRPAFVTPGRFAGKVVVVTGAAQGIGERTARRIAAEGGTLVLADRSDLVSGLAEELGAVPVLCDLERYDGARAMVEEADGRLGRVDVLVNNVGGAINFKPFTEFTDTEIAAEVDRSLMTTLYACRAVLPGMVDRGRGVIVNVSSAATRGIHRIPYSAAKGGINAITASLALEYADAGIRVVATAPGGTEAPPRRISRGTPEARTEQEKAWFRAHVDQTLEHSLLHRYGTLDEQAAAITFLASDEASYITGTVLPVAGGDLG